MAEKNTYLDYDKISQSITAVSSVKCNQMLGGNAFEELSTTISSLSSKHDGFESIGGMIANLESSIKTCKSDLDNLYHYITAAKNCFKQAESPWGDTNQLLPLLPGPFELDKTMLDKFIKENEYWSEKEKNRLMDSNIVIAQDEKDFKKNMADSVKKAIEEKTAAVAASSAQTTVTDKDKQNDLLKEAGFYLLTPFAMSSLLPNANIDVNVDPVPYKNAEEWKKAVKAAYIKKGISPKAADQMADQYIKDYDKIKARRDKSDTTSSSDTANTEQKTDKGNPTENNVEIVAKTGAAAAATAVSGPSQQPRVTADTGGGSDNLGNFEGKVSSSDSPGKIGAELKPGKLPNDGKGEIGAELKPGGEIKPDPKPDVIKPDNKPDPLPDTKPDSNQPAPLPDNKPDNSWTNTDNNSNANTNTNTNTGGGSTSRPATNTGGGSSNSNSATVTPPVQEPSTPTETPTTPDSSTGTNSSVGDSLDVISIDKETPKTTGTTTKSSGGSNVIPIGLGVAAAGAAAVAGARFIKNRTGKEDSDENYEEEGNSFSYLGNYQDDGKYEENVSAGSNLYEDTLATSSPSKYKAGSVNKLVLDNGADVKIQSDDIINQKEELE